MHFLELIQKDVCHPEAILLSKEKRWTCATCLADGVIRQTLTCHPDSVVLVQDIDPPRWQCRLCPKSRMVDRSLRCHPESLSLKDVPVLTCRQCGGGRNAFTTCCTNVYQYIQGDFDDHFHSSRLAQAFHEWSGDEHVPVTFPLSDLRGLYSKRVKGLSLARMQETVSILRAINAPFTTEFSTSGCCPEMEHFLTHFFNFLTPTQQQQQPPQQQQQQQSAEKKVIDMLMASMRQLIQSKEFSNPFEMYFSKLIPLIQFYGRHEKWNPFPALPVDSNLALELYTQLVRSDHIRNTFSKYSILFDTIHVLLGCYACSSDSDAVANWILDMIARICRGEYFWKRYETEPSVGVMQRFLQSNITYQKNTHLYHVVRAFRNGESSEVMSANWPTFMQLQVFVSNHFKLPNVSADLLELVCGHLFPSVLFGDHCDQLGFTLQLGHLMTVTCPRTGQITKKGSFKMARKIHMSIARIMKRIQEFDTIQNIWTIDTLQQFLASDDNNNLVKELTQICKGFIHQEDDQDD